MTVKPTRREFLGTTAATATAAWTGGRLYAADADAKSGPNETVNLALIGCGGQGRHDMRRCLESTIQDSASTVATSAAAARRRPGRRGQA